MKFGKSIVASQVAGWSDYYLNYKALKKIINSLAAGRPASEAAFLAIGGRPSKRRLSSTDSPHLASSSPSVSTATTPTFTPTDGSHLPGTVDLDPLPPQTAPPAAGGSSSILSGRSGGSGGVGHGESFKAHRDVFFFTLQRELEKINAFYLIKERDLRLRLLTLLSNRKRLLQSRHEMGEDGVIERAKRSAEWSSLEEGWRLFERDLGKLQGFIEVNATGFRKILKKWDKRSKSNTQELYLERQVEVQPCFNREFIAKLSDIVAANLLDIENGSDHLSASFFAPDLPDPIGDDGLAFDRDDYESDRGHALTTDALFDLEADLPKVLESGGREGIAAWLRLARSRLSNDVRDSRAMRILWRAALSVPDDYLDLVFATPLDFHYIDNINDRSPLHQACIVGSLRVVQLCVSQAPDLVRRPDAYARHPLHYAALHGHPSIVSLLLQSDANASATDMDGYTPLMHAITQGHLEVVRIFVSGETNLEPTAVSTDLIPLSLACQYGQVEVARLLLERRAKVIPNSEGLYPMHLAAQAGHEAICRLLVESGGPDGGGKDKQDKYNLWTPLHHAAVGGSARHLACIHILVEAGCDVNTPDEYGKSPGWYAAWFGHVTSLNYLLDSGAQLSSKEAEIQGMESLGLAADPQMDALTPGSDLDLDADAEDFELIPSLSLPPPIIPLRVYGHEFLAKRYLVQLSLGHPFTRGLNKVAPVKLYSRSAEDGQEGQGSLHLWSSLKLVMTSTSDVSIVPHSVILPLADDREVFSFQVQSLDKFSLELSLYPTFGSKVVGRAVILPSTFQDVAYHQGFVAPLLDHHLKTIGEVSMEISCIKPFEGAQLEIGGKVETYWKSKVTPSNPTQDHAHQFQSHRPAGVSTSSPAQRPAPGPAQEPALVTASSLSGEYVKLTVQVTKDKVPVVYSKFRLPYPELDGFNIGVSDVTFAQFNALASKQSQLPALSVTATPDEWDLALRPVMTSLEHVLSVMPAEVGINLGVMYTRQFDADVVGVGRSAEVNGFVDAVLQVVYDVGKVSPGRKIIFSSFDPTVCTALNWKQPNYAVFFASFCGVARERTSGNRLVAAAPEEESDNRCLSVREAVNFAKSTNLLGVILEATTLAAVPSLVASVKDAGLLLATFGDAADVARLRQGASDGRTVDAFCSEGIMTLVI